MRDVNVKGSTGDIAGGNINKRGNDSNAVKWIVRLVVGVVLVIALAWGSNTFSVSWWGASNETEVK